jgi:hypothetical protein
VGVRNNELRVRVQFDYSDRRGGGVLQALSHLRFQIYDSRFWILDFEFWRRCESIRPLVGLRPEADQGAFCKTQSGVGS